jgi:SAM-dependent methyltransferase
VYGLFARRAEAGADAFMNYGYAPLSGSAEAGSFGAALYDRVVGATNLAGKDVLEVGCGRGRGTAHVFDRHAPRSMVGVDLTPAAIRRCRASFQRPGLRFRVADAEDLPFADGSFDVVLNVESSHCYPDVPAFLDEAHRVLRPGGVLLLADARHTSLDRMVAGGPVRHEDIGDLRRQVRASPFTVVDEEDLTANVIWALRLDSERRRAVVESRVPRLLQPQALNFAAVEGTALHDAYVAGDTTYLRLALRKNGGM